MPKAVLLPEIIYEHRCGCSMNGTNVAIRPETRFSYYLLVEPRCIETGALLVRIRDNHVSGS